MPFMLAESGSGLEGNNKRASAARTKIPLRIKLPKDVKQVAGVLGEGSAGVYLLGGGAFAAAAGSGLPYANLLIDTKDFTALKKSIFEFGVTPVSTADLPANFIRFVHQDRAYSVLNMNFDTYMHLTTIGQENGLILFAHNFLVYSIDGGFALDPYDALGAKAADGKSFLIKMVRQPANLVHAFNHCLAAIFDRALLGVKTSPELTRVEDRVFQSVPNAADSKEIFSRVLDYSSDVLEVAGLDTACQLLTAPVCLAAGKTTAGIDLAGIESSLRQMQRKGTAVTGREFMLAVHVELKKKAAGPGSAQGLPEFLAANREQFRRMEVVIEAMEAAPG
jgi:hypothetical protein